MRADHEEQNEGNITKKLLNAFACTKLSGRYYICANVSVQNLCLRRHGLKIA